MILLETQEKEKNLESEVSAKRIKFISILSIIKEKIIKYMCTYIQVSSLKANISSLETSKADVEKEKSDVEKSKAELQDQLEEQKKANENQVRVREFRKVYVEKCFYETLIEGLNFWM